jgi:hypothetical protein
MMQGIVNQNCEATLPIAIKHGTITQLIWEPQLIGQVAIGGRI